MFFCNTCCQPLCVSCREETHRARMFARHEVVLLTKKAKDIQKECSKRIEFVLLLESLFYGSYNVNHSQKFFFILLDNLFIVLIFNTETRT